MGKRHGEHLKTALDISITVNEITKRVLKYNAMADSDITDSHRLELKKLLQQFEISYNENPESLKQWKLYVNAIAMCMKLCGRKQLSIGGIQNRRRLKFSGAESFAGAVEEKLLELKRDELFGSALKESNDTAEKKADEEHRTEH